MIKKFTLFVLLTLNSTHLWAEASPEASVNYLHATLIQAMQQADELGYQGRYQLLAPVVTDSFDFQVIAKLSMGRHWKKLDEVQQALFIEIFTKLAIATYAQRFNGYSGQEFSHLTNENMKKDRVLVKTQLVTEERVIPFNYILQPDGQQWHIINAIVDGVSDLSLKRSDYAAIMKSEGFESLIQKLQSKIDSAQTSGAGS